MIPKTGDRPAPGNRDGIVEPGWSAAGANSLFMVEHHAGFATLLQPVGIGVATLFLVAVIWSRLRPGRQYPDRWW